VPRGDQIVGRFRLLVIIGSLLAHAAIIPGHAPRLSSDLPAEWASRTGPVEARASTGSAHVPAQRAAPSDLGCLAGELQLADDVLDLGVRRRHGLGDVGAAHALLHRLAERL